MELDGLNIHILINRYTCCCYNQIANFCFLSPIQLVISDISSVILMSFLILLVANLLHPVGCPTVKLFLYSNMGHGSSCGSTMPVLFTWMNPNYVTWMNFLDSII